MSRDLSLRGKISIIVAIVVILIMLVVAIVIYNSTSKIVMQQVNEKINILNRFQIRILNDLIEKLERKINNIPEDLLISIYTETAFEKKLEYNQQQSQQRENIENEYSFNEFITYVSPDPSRALQLYINEIDYAQLAYIVTPDGIIIADSRYISRLSGYTTVGNKLPVSLYKNIKFSTLKQIEDNFLLLINTPIKNNEKEVVGYLVVGISPGIFKNNLDDSVGDYGSVSLINEDGYILNDSNKKMIGRKIEESWYINQIKQGRTESEKITDEGYLQLRKAGNRNMYFAINISLDKIISPASRIRNIIIYISVIGIMIIIAVVFLAINWQLNPLHNLIKKMDKVSNGNMDVKVNVKRRDEIGKVALNFNKMVKEIKKLLNKVKKDQEEIHKYELKALQAQINPHFLYNTLDSINWMTKAGELKEIDKMTVALSKFFRLSLNKGKDITSIKNEVEHVKNYLTIQKLRFPDKFECKIDIDSKLYNCQCVKLILQPLVENSLLHGLEEIETGGIIEIKGKKENNDLILQVCDNGCGFDPEKMRDLISETNNSSEGYALKNVQKRINIYYGNDYGLSFSENADQGACVTIRLPVKQYRGDDN